MESPFPPRCAREFSAERLLAAGGFGKVWLARQLALDRPVAIKVLEASLLADAMEVARFTNEARITAGLAHPHIVVLIDHDVEDGTPWIAYEYVPGRSLRSVLAGGRLDVALAASVALQVAAALAAAHARGVIHRDIKPDNVLEAEPGRYKVADFGIAKWSATEVHTQDGLVLGTPAYLSPEQVRGEPPCEGSDLYALGVMLHEMLAGALPFAAANPIELLRMHVTDPPPPLARADLPRALAGLVGRLLEKSPDDRFRSATELIAALQPILDAVQDRRAAAAATGPPIAPPPVRRQVSRTARVAGPSPTLHAPAPVPPALAARHARALAAAGLVLGIVALVLRPVAAPQPRWAPGVTAPGRSSGSPRGSTRAVPVLERYVPEFERALERLDVTRGADIALACGRALEVEDRARGATRMPRAMWKVLVDVLARDVSLLLQEFSKDVVLASDANERRYRAMVQRAGEVGGLLLRGGAPFPLEHAYGRAASQLFSRRCTQRMTGGQEAPLKRRVDAWLSEHPDRFAPRLMEIQYYFESGHKNRVLAKRFDALNRFLALHFPPAVPEATVEAVEEWYLLASEAAVDCERLKDPGRLVDLAQRHEKARLAFGRLKDHPARHRPDLEKRLGAVASHE